MLSIKDLYRASQPALAIPAALNYGRTKLMNALTNKKEQPQQPKEVLMSREAYPMSVPGSRPAAMPPVPKTTDGGSGPLFTGGGTQRVVTPPPAQTPVVEKDPSVPQQWIKPDGSFYTPDEIAEQIAGNIQQNRDIGGDIGNLSAQQFSPTPKTAEQLATEARNINNVRNDIAVGEIDPDNVASGSGIAYTPAELDAIESARAGIYTPALDSAMSKLEQKRIEDDAAREAATEKERDERLFAQDLQKMDKQFALDRALKLTPAPGAGGTPSPTGEQYVPGANPIVDGWVEKLLRSGESLEKAIPGVANQGLRNQVMLGLNARRYESAATAGTLSDINDINLLLSNEDLDNISGPVGQFLGGKFGQAKDAAVLFDKLSGVLQLAEAGSIKGQGAVSEFERKILQQAAVEAQRGQSDEGFRNSLVKIRGALSTASGLEAPVRIIDPTTGQSQVQELSSTEIADFIKDGALIEYVEQ